jgi:hypothetical protein
MDEPTANDLKLRGIAAMVTVLAQKAQATVRGCGYGLSVAAHTHALGIH